MPESNTKLDEQERLAEELVAYLDGELDAESSRRVEQRLARDPAVLKELNRLERAWQMLERLPRAEVSETFTQTTVEMVAVKAAKDLQAERARQPLRRWKNLLAAATIAVIAAGLGFMVSRLQWPDPNDQLARDLPILENLEQYRQVEDIEFLRSLHESGLFEPEDPPADEP
jgi:anti-sigma factor RsiW